jgi:glycosyltransferase involved in cell wall biosynthesis
MKIAVCAVQVPFVRGGAESHCDNLCRELINRGYEVEHIKLPFKWYPPQEIINHSLMWRLLDLSESNGSKIDGVIATKFPSYMIKHNNKVVWLLHQYRAAYDRAFTEYDDLFPYGKLGDIVRKKIYYMDKKHLGEAKKIFTNAQNTADRLWKYNKIQGEALYHPPPLMGQYFCNDYQDYIFYPSRIDSLKRQELMVRSMKHVGGELRLKIAGTGPRLNDCMKLAKDLGVEDRVDFLGYVSDEQLLDLYANSSCVAYVPIDEDFGYVTLEGFLSKKPIITCDDSGGPLEFVEDSVNGCVSRPESEDIAKKINYIYDNQLCKKMGEMGYSKIDSMNLSWDQVISKLIEAMS